MIRFGLTAVAALLAAVLQFDRRVDIMGFDVPMPAPLPSYTVPRSTATLTSPTSGTFISSSGTVMTVGTGTVTSTATGSATSWATTSPHVRVIAP